ncbi:hypothetical protein GCM10011588_72290 [Nocardia jinanensis]|uniref:Uncharacterized protein n=1 Tax=Nocardia jinanensis TaxID=382504 RepID=A0A917VYY4_9NOCA|nr:hypothetical protein GCM10011588_72290 [Nocardia jinanensis]
MATPTRTPPVEAGRGIPVARAAGRRQYLSDPTTLEVALWLLSVGGCTIEG